MHIGNWILVAAAVVAVVFAFASAMGRRLAYMAPPPVNVDCDVARRTLGIGPYSSGAPRPTAVACIFRDGPLDGETIVVSAPVMQGVDSAGGTFWYCVHRQDAVAYFVGFGSPSGE